MKKPVLLLLTLICAVILAFPAAASEKPDTHTLYKKMEEKINESTAIAIKETTHVDVSADDRLTWSGKSVSVIKQNAYPDRLEIVYHLLSSSTEEPQDVYFKDGHYYYTYTGEKIRLDKVLNKGGVRNALSLSLEDEELENGTVEALPDGNYKIRVPARIEGDELTETMAETILGPLKKDAIADYDIKFGIISCAFTVKPDGEPVSLACAYNLYMVEEGVQVKIRTNVSQKVLSINQPLQIDFPADLHTYVLAE